MIRFIAAVLIATTAVAVSPVSAASICAAQSQCCKVCKKGKACGDSCIAKNKACTKARGCACNAR